MSPASARNEHSTFSQEDEGIEKGVLVTDGELHFTVAVLRSLGEKNVPVTVGVEHKDVPALYSKYCTESVLYPSAKKDAATFVKVLSKYISKRNYDAVFPMGDLTLWPISLHREILNKHAKLPFPAHSFVEESFDKSKTVESAQNCGVPVPKTYNVKNVAELKNLSTRITYPAVVKSRFSWFWKNDRTTTQTNIRPEYALTPNELVQVFTGMHEKSPFPIIQEYVPGHNYSVALLCDNSNVKASCFIKVHRTIPLMGGNSTYRETVNPNPQMMDYAVKLMKALNWHGIAEVEFRLDERDSEPKLMEVNGRFWGSLQTAILAGVDFPYLLYKLIVHGSVTETKSYKVGIRNRWLGGDVRYLAYALKGDYHAYKHLPQRKWQALRDLVRLDKGTCDEIHRRDLLPFFMSLRRWREFGKSRGSA